jgi:hypothetical protein
MVPLELEKRKDEEQKGDVREDVERGYLYKILAN